MVVYRSVKMLCDYERKQSDMKKITIDNTEYVVYGNNEKKITQNHILKLQKQE